MLCCLLLYGKVVQAHSPDLSNLMIYEQNGKYLLVIKSSLTALDGEIDYVFGKNAYKSAEEFQLLVIKHFHNNCVIIMNGDTIKLINPKVNLGHETTLFAELKHVPNKLKSIFISNTLFKDMPANMSELILILKGLPQKQYILNNDNKHEVQLTVENNRLTVLDVTGSPYKTINILMVVVLLLVASLIAIIVLRKQKLITQDIYLDTK
jgi:hypothetical protein